MEHLSDYKTQLETELSTILEELQSIAVLDTETGDWITRTTDLDTTEVDENTQADVAEEADERVSILSELETRYRLIMHALTKIENGTYGVCEISGEQIEEGRLQANPAARTCVAHMESEKELPHV